MAGTKGSPIYGPNTQAAESQEVNQTGEPQHRGSIEESNLRSGGPTHEKIAARAYQCWQERGGTDGASEEDWYRAEQELRGGHARAGHKLVRRRHRPDEIVHSSCWIMSRTRFAAARNIGKLPRKSRPQIRPELGCREDRKLYRKECSKSSL